MTNVINRILGDTPWRVVVKLIIFSLIVGGLMTMLGWTPMDVIWKIVNFFRHIWSLGFASVTTLARVVVLGAAIVIPIFIILRILSWRR